MHLILFGENSVKYVEHQDENEEKENQENNLLIVFCPNRAL
jgi:hypothetical protein